METKFTPGPWLQSHRKIANGNYSTQVYDSNGKEIADIALYPVRDGNVTKTNREANARLIAAAPDLYEALQSLCAIAPSLSCQDFDHIKKDQHEFTDKCPLVERYEFALTKAKIALAKARGEA